MFKTTHTVIWIIFIIDGCFVPFAHSVQNFEFNCIFSELLAFNFLHVYTENIASVDN